MSAFVFAGSVFSQELGREQKFSEKPREEGSVAACNISPLTMIDVAYKNTHGCSKSKKQILFRTCSW